MQGKKKILNIFNTNVLARPDLICMTWSKNTNGGSHAILLKIYKL